MNARLLETERLRIILATIAINVVAVSLLALAPWSDWRTGLGLNIIDNVLLIGTAENFWWSARAGTGRPDLLAVLNALRAARSSGSLTDFRA